MELNSLEDIEKNFPDEDTARKYLANLRWGQWANCPYCLNAKCYFIENGLRYKCASKACYKKFSVTTKTLIEATNIPLNTWIKIVFVYIKSRGRCMSWDFEKECNISRLSAFICKEKLDFVWKGIDRVGKDMETIINEVFIKIFISYEFYQDFQQSKYTSKWHIADGDINDIGDPRQYNILINYIKYYVNVYCYWIWMDFATPTDILSECFIIMKEKGIKEYNGSSIIKLIQYTVNCLWYKFLKELPKYYNKISQWQKRHKENARLNLNTSYIVELIHKNDKNKRTRSEIRKDLTSIDNRKRDVLNKRKRGNKNYEFQSHFI